MAASRGNSGLGFLHVAIWGYFFKIRFYHFVDRVPFILILQVNPEGSVCFKKSCQSHGHIHRQVAPGIYKLTDMRFRNMQFARVAASRPSGPINSSFNISPGWIGSIGSSVLIIESYADDFPAHSLSLTIPPCNIILPGMESVFDPLKFHDELKAADVPDK